MAINQQIMDLAEMYNDNIVCFVDDITIGYSDSILL